MKGQFSDVIIPNEISSNFNCFYLKALSKNEQKIKSLLETEAVSDKKLKGMSFKKLLLELIDPNLHLYYDFFLLEFSSRKEENHLKEKFEEYFKLSETRKSINSQEKMQDSSKEIKTPQNKIKQSIEDNLMKNSKDNNLENIKESLENNILSPELQKVDSYEDNSKKLNYNNEENEENPKDFASEEQFFEKDRK